MNALGVGSNMNRRRIDHVYEGVRREVVFPVPHGDFTRALESLLGRGVAFALAEVDRDTPERARTKLGAVAGVSGFALFQKIDHGAVGRALSGRGGAAITYVLGNVLVGAEITVHEALAGLYLPPRLLVCDHGAGRVMVTYDLPSAALAQFDSAAVDAAAATLDVRLAKLLDVAAALAGKIRRYEPGPGAEGGRR